MGTPAERHRPTSTQPHTGTQWIRDIVTHPRDSTARSGGVKAKVTVKESDPNSDFAQLKTCATGRWSFAPCSTNILVLRYIQVIIYNIDIVISSLVANVPNCFYRFTAGESE